MYAHILSLSALSALCDVSAGKYTETNLPKGPRGAVINTDRVREVQPLLSLMRDIGSAHGNKTPGQVGGDLFRHSVCPDGDACTGD